MIRKTKEELFKIIKEQSEQLENIHSNIDDVIWIARFDPFEILYINKASEIVYGYSAEEMMHDATLFYNNIHPDDLTHFEESVNNTFTNGKSSCEFRVMHKDGNYRNIKAQSILQKNSGSIPDTLCGIATDVTALRKTEGALIEKVNEIETILEGITNAFCAVDEKWNFTYVNHTFGELFDADPGELINKNLWNCFPKLLFSFFHGGMIAAQNKHEKVKVEGVSPTTGKMLSASFYPFKNGLAMDIVDITNQVKQNQTIQIQQQQLSEIAQYQSHQVRGPVATILGLAQLLNPQDDDNNKKILEGLVTAAKNLDEAVKQINKRTKQNELAA
ncbi:MAG: PAS domain S-box protein [Bacteroidetes bacterium]|nr:PAS domain S-box protein [Bacteroidota bacterium]